MMQHNMHMYARASRHAPQKDEQAASKFTFLEPCVTPI